MILPRNLKMLFRTISAFVAGIFLFQQISWAGDLAGRMTDATLKRLDAEQAQTFAPDYLQNQQALHQDLVNLNQDIEDYNNTILSAPSDGAGTGSEPVNDPVELKGPMGSSIIAIPDPIFDFPNVKGCLEDLLSPENGEAGGALMSVTTQSGDIIHYKQDGRIDYIETVSDPVIRLIRGLSVEDGVLMEAVIEYRDGTIQEIGRSKTVRATLPDGTILYYDEEGLVRYVFYPDGALAVCEDNVPDSDGEPVRILKEYSKDGYSGITPSSISILNDPKRTLYYNLNNRLKRVKFNSGKTIYYDDGILSRVETEDGLTYIYESEEGVSPEGDAEYTVRLSEVINVFGRTYRLDDGSIIEVMVSSEGGTDTYRFVDGFEGNPDNGITCADFDGNGFDDILVDFGQGHGLWVKYDNVYWQRLHELSPQSVTAGDFDGDGRKEIIADFGEGHGIHMCDYKPDSTYQWSQVHPESPESITPIDLNSDGKDEIIFDYSQYGVWTWDQDQWVRINETSCGQVVTVDLDGDGKDEVIFDYDQYGVYTWDPDRQDPWTQINATSCDQIITADIDGDGKDEAIFNYSQYGVWTWDQERQDQWIQINVTSCDRMVAADIDGDGKDEAIFDYSQYGVYTWDPDNATPWWQINVTSPDKISVLDFDGDGKDEAIFDYVQCGIYTWNNDDINPWFQINSVNSLSITVANLDNNGKDDVVIDFGSPYCTYINFDVSNWYQLHSLSPKSLCPADDQTAYACMDTSRADDFYYWYGSPGEMFDGMGNLRADYDYTDLPYFDTIIYGGDRRVRETRNPDGTIADLSENILPLKSFDELFSGAVMLPQGRTLSVTKPDGTIFYYNTEAASDLVESVVYPDGSVTTYEYNVKDADGEAVTVLYDSDKTSYYTAAGRLKRVEFNSGKVIRYDDGVILEVIGDESGDYYFDIAQETDGIYSRLKTFIDRDGYRLDFGSTVTSLSIITPSGAKITYGEDESVIEILIEDPDGRTARYDAAGNLVSVEEGGLIVTGTDIDEAEDTFDELTLALYAAYGDLNQAQSDYYQKYFIWQDAYNKLKRLTFWERLFNKSLVKKRTNAEIEARDARDKAYSELQAASGVVTNLSNEKQTAQMNLNALRSVFEKFPSNIAENDCWEDLADIDLAAFKAKLRFTAVIYDEEREIRRVLDPDGNLITAANDGLPTAGLGDSSYLIRNNGLGNIDQISVCRDRIQRIYDASGMLKSLELDENTKVIYKDGEVAEVYKTIPETGKKVTIKDFGYDTATAEKKLIEYAVYQDDGSKILYKNDVIDSKITTEGNIIRYASERIDTVEEPDGKVYKYIYGEDPDDNIRKELIQYILSDGTVIKLTGGVITGATLTNGLELIDPVFDDTGNILSAECLLEGGAIGTIKYGVLEKATLPDQAEIYYKDGLIHTVVKPDGSILAYSYTLDDDLNITGTIVEMMGMTYCYDENGILQQAETADYTAGYTDGMLTSIDMPYQNISITDATFGAGYEVIGGAVHLADDWTYHLKDGELEYVTMPNGADVTFDADNRYITRIEQKGVIETYAYNRDVSGRLLSANVTHNRSGEFVTEDIGVYLASITDPTWQIIADRLPCDHFGDIYSTYLRSDFGNIEVKHYGPLIPMPGDSDVRIAINYNVLPETTYMYAYEYSFYLNTEYPDSLVYLAIRKDAATTGSAPITIDFYNHYTSLRDYSFSLSDVSSEWEDMTLYLGGNTDNPKIVRYTIPCDDDAARSGSIYIAHMAAMAIKEYDISTDWKDDLIPDEIMKPFFDADISLPFADSYLRSISFSAQVPISEFYGSTPLYAVYDKNDKLLELKRTEGSILTFGDTGPEGWTWTDENGIDCKIEYEYDGFTVTKALLFPEPGLTEPDAVLEYKDGRIYRATKAGAVYSYEYPVDAEGAEFVEITNDSTKYVYLYKDGKITSNTSDEGLVTDYIYNGERISSSRVTFEGAVVETFTYEYADGLTIVIDEQGVRRTYDNSNTLIFLETAEGLGYRYNYGEDDEGNDVLEVDLYQAAGDNGIIVYHKEGNIDSIQLKDGTIININDSENPEALQDITFKDGLVDTVTYETGEVAKYIRDEYGRLETIEVKSGLATRWYNPEGELIKSQENPNEYYLYGYTRTETGAIEYVEVQKVTVDEICGAALPARVYAFSAGYFDGWDAGIIVNDKGESAFNTNFWHQANNEQYTGCGWDVVVIDDETGTVLKKGFFNVNHLGEGEAERMADFINSVSDGDFVAATVGDEGWYHLTESAKRALESIGSARIRELYDHDSFAIIGRKGAAAGSAKELLNKRGTGPAIISNYTIERSYYDKDGNPVGSEALHEAPDVNWYSIRPTQITDEIEPLYVDSKGYASSYIKNFNPSYPDSGFIRLWDEMNDVYETSKMDELYAMVGDKTHKAIYYDSRYPTNWTTASFSSRMVNYFVSKGFQVLNADELRQFLKSYGEDSVVIMGQDVAPSTIVSRYTWESPVRPYLEEGGTFVWMHDIPFHYIGYADADKTKYKIGEIGQRRLLGIITPIVNRGQNEFDKYTPLKEDCSLYDPAIPPDAEALDIGTLYFDPSVNCREIRWDRVKASIGYELDEETAVISDYDKDGKLRALVKADRTITFYSGDGKVEYVTDIHGDTIAGYTYDEEGAITALCLEQARRDAEIKIEEMKYRMSEEKRETIAELTIQSAENVQIIRSAYDAARAPLYAALNDLQRMYDDNEKRKIYWWQWGAKEEKNRTRDYILGEMGKVRRYISELNAQEAAEISGYETQVADLIGDLDTEEARVLADVELKKQELLDQISVQEARPVIQERYRDILGRDPGETEIEVWLDAVKNSPDRALDVAALCGSLRDTSDPDSEYNRRMADIAWIRAEVERELRGYLDMAADNERGEYLSSLGLTAADVVSITADDVDKITAWLSGQNPHFGRSASNVLGELLKAKGVDYEDRELVKLAILIDVLTGSINRFSNGKLLISAYALKNIARIKGFILTPVKISIEELARLVPAGSGKKAILFIGGKHYVVLEGIDIANDEVTYRETSQGPGGEVVKLKVKDFLESWQGNYALIEDTPPVNECTILTDYQSKKIRGACFVELFFLIAAIFSAVAQVIAAIAAAVVTIIQTVVIAVQGIIQAGLALMANFIGGIAGGIGAIGEAIFAGVKFVGMSLFKGFASFFSTGLLASGAEATFAETVVTFVGKTVVSVAANYAINAGLEALGVDPMISNLISAFVTGGITGAIGNPVEGFFHFQSAFGALAMQGVNYLGTIIDLPPPIVSALSMAAGTLTEGMFDLSTVSETITEVGINLASEAAFAGVGLLGDWLGVDPRISYVLGLPIVSSIQVGLTPGTNPTDIWNSITDGLLRGAVTIGMEFATQDLDPLIGAITARILSGAIAGGLSEDHDVFKGIYDALIESTGSIFTLDGPGDNPWSRAVYISKILSVSQMIQERGLAETLETCATSIFYRDAVESMIRNGGTVFNYIQTALNNPEELPENLRPSTTTFDGEAALIMPTGETGDYLIISADGSEILAQSKGTYYNEGEFGIDYQGEMVLKNGTSTNYTELGLVSLDVRNYALTDAEFQSYDGDVAYQIYGENGQAVEFDSNGDFKNAVIKNLTSNTDIVVRNGEFVTNQTSATLQESLSQSEPWYSKFALSQYVDITDQKIDQMADWFLGDAQNNMGWILSATAVNSAKDFFKATVTDIFRFGESLPGALDNFSGAWEAAQSGDALSAGYQAFLGSGKILQEVGRALVVGSVVKGLAVSALRLEGGVAVNEALVSAKQLAAQSGKKTTVIGRRWDTAVAEGWPNHNVLNLPDPLWNEAVNYRWLDDAISRGDEIFLASPLSKAEPGTMFLKEIEYLRERGYEVVGAYMKRK